MLLRALWRFGDSGGAVCAELSTHELRFLILGLERRCATFMTTCGYSKSFIAFPSSGFNIDRVTLARDTRLLARVAVSSL